MTKQEELALQTYCANNYIEYNENVIAQFNDLKNIYLITSAPTYGMTIEQQVQMTSNQILNDMLDEVFNSLDEYEENLVIISNNAWASHLCIHRQGKVYWVKKPQPPYTKLEPELWRSGGGLFHPNCRHNMSVYFPGQSDPPTKINSISEQESLYKKQQQDRYRYRQKRKWETEYAKAKTVNSDNLDYYKRKIAYYS